MPIPKYWIMSDGKVNRIFGIARHMYPGDGKVFWKGEDYNDALKALSNIGAPNDPQMPLFKENGPN